MTKKATAIAIAVVEDDDRFLIGQRAADAILAGLWEFPGGKIEVGESPKVAAVRECMEESGIAVRVHGEYPSHVHDYPHGRVVLHFLNCSPVHAGSSPAAPFRWVNRSELQLYRFPDANKQILAKLTQSEE